MFAHHQEGDGDGMDEQTQSDVERQKLGATESELSRKSKNEEMQGRMVDVVLSDMSAPFDQTTGFWKRSLSDPYYRMMNTSGISFKDHAGSMVSKVRCVMKDQLMLL